MDNSRLLLTNFIIEQRQLLPPFGPEQLDMLLRYATWLEDEAIPAGGLGPNEADRIMHRHVLDSLTLVVAAEGLSPSCIALDVGSGSGLPGIPLAIAFPGGNFTLTDRSGRRCTLIKRAVRVLGLENVTVLHQSIEETSGRFDLITSRATLPPADLLPHLRRWLAPGGVAIVAGSATGPIEVPGYTTTEFRSEVLGNSRWMLMMRSS